jgi:hypothetical protein
VAQAKGTCASLSCLRSFYGDADDAGVRCFVHAEMRAALQGGALAPPGHGPTIDVKLAALFLNDL